MREKDDPARDIPARSGTRGLTRRRVAAVSGSLVIAALAGMILLRILAPDGVGWLDLLRLILVMVATFWLAWGAALAVIGVVAGRDLRTRSEATDTRRITGRTVILVPIHHEDPVATFARIAAMIADLDAQGLSDHVQVAILSDTRDAALAARERLWVARLSAEIGGEGRLFYRRRASNAGRKAGNIADFIRRSGAAWDYALILDADSLMAADTIGRMIRRIETAPQLGLLQSAPVVIRSRTIFGRAMQFAAAFHGPAYMRGIAALQGRSGPFWGHNAIVRIRAFAQSCGLPELSGPPPFGGHILSHDYVEAALLARAGWQVRLDPDLPGSFEEAPETILSHAARDRRWCQGNLQHGRLLAAPGLRPWSRFVFLQGILAYVAPVLWIVILAASLLAAMMAAQPFEPVLIPLIGANPLEGSMAEWLMTQWAAPMLEPDMAATALGLALGVVGLLVVPKLLILAAAVRTGRVAGFGGGPRAVCAVLAELALSAIIAPVLLMFQVRSVAEVLTGRDGGWPIQARGGDEIPLSQAWSAAWWISLTGLGIAGAAVVLAPELLKWLSPVCLPMILAPLVITWTARPGTGWLFATPPERDPPPVMQHQAAILARWQARAEPVCVDAGLRAVTNG